MTDRQPSFELGEMDMETLVFGDAITQLRAAQREIDEAPEGTDLSDIMNRYQPCVKTIAEYCNTREITATGSNLIIPEFDDDGRFQGLIKTQGSVTGSLRGISLNKIGELEDQRYIIGMVLKVGGVHSESPVHEQVIIYKAFVPFESSEILVDPIEEILLPEADDTTAAAIDEALLNEQVDFPALIELFQANSWTDMEQDMYLHYLNKIASFQTVTAFASYGWILPADGTMKCYEEPGGGYMLEGTFYEFMIAMITDTEYESSRKLMLTAIDARDNTIGVFLESITDIQLR